MNTKYFLYELRVNQGSIMELYAEDSEHFNEWQQIQHPFPETSPTVQQSGGGWNTAVIRENYLLPDGRSSIPPPNHEDEGLQIVPTDLEDGNSSSSSSTGFVSDDDVTPMPSRSAWRLRVADEGWKLLKLRFEAVRAGVVRVASKVRDYAICVGAFWSMTYLSGVTVAALVLLVFVGIQRRRHRQRLRQQSMDHLAILLREKDEKISQLLLQIAHLNEVLLSRRKVPVLRICS